MKRVKVKEPEIDIMCFISKGSSGSHATVCNGEADHWAEGKREGKKNQYMHVHVCMHTCFEPANTMSCFYLVWTN